MAIVGVGDSHTSAKAELLRAHGCPIPVLADSYILVTTLPTKGRKKFPNLPYKIQRC